MGLLDRLKPTTPTPRDLVSAAAHDFREADKLHKEGMAKLTKLRETPPALADAMSVMKAVIDAGRKDLEALADERLKALLDPNFDDRWLGELDMTLNARFNSLASCTFALFPDAWLALAEQRLRLMGCDKSKLTLKEKRKQVAELEAEVSQIAQARDNALTTWRKLTNDRTGRPE